MGPLRDMGEVWTGRVGRWGCLYEVGLRKVERFK